MPTDKIPKLGERGYPRPLLRRPEWHSLNGPWQFAADPEGKFERPEQVRFDREIQVPYSPETAKSGILHAGPLRACWYRRLWDPGAFAPDKRIILHFGAVDYLATVWVGGHVVARHEGGYQPFSADVTEHLRPGKATQILVWARDDPLDLAKPRGKQDWQEVPHSIWYPGTTGIWQTVWYEPVPVTRIESLRWTSSIERWEVALDTRILGPNLNESAVLSVRLSVGEKVIANDTYSALRGDVHRRITLSDPGIDDSRNELLWRPESPTLIHADLELRGPDGQVLDQVESHAALRDFSARGHRLLLNGRPYPLRMVLDQGYWPETGLTAPDDRALYRDVVLAKAMGFNGVRKHQKIEDPRYLYWADRLGLLVFEEMPSAYRFTRDSVERLIQQWLEVIHRDASHPSIVAWVPFNESWGVPNLPQSRTEQHYVKALYALTKTLDPDRLVLGNDGWESVATDIIGIHDYDDSPERILRRYGSRDALPRLLAHEHPGGRALVVGNGHSIDHPVVLSEFGGIALSATAGVWGYSKVQTPEELEAAYCMLLDTVHRLELLSGFCYTQFADTYQEANGLLYADRTPKFPIERIRTATIGRDASLDALEGGPAREPFEVP